jgi:hypothetical protein
VDSSGLPAVDLHVDLSTVSGVTYPSRVEGVNGDIVRVTAPMNPVELLQPGAPLELAWLRGRSWVAVSASFVGVTGGQFPCWDVRVLGEVRRQTRREFVRSGSGETIQISRPGAGQPRVVGVVMDIGEAGVRVRLGICDFQLADPVVLTFRLGTERLLTAGHVLDVRHLAESGCSDLVIALEPTEAMRRIIVSYVLRRELEERRRSASGG